MKKSTRARQDYVKALYALGGEGTVVATSSVASRLGVSAPSTTNMLRRLAGDGLVTLLPGRGARLTAAGRRLALDLVRRHRILESFLVKVLGFDWSEVHEDAEILEHHVSDRVLRAMDRVAGHPQEDPHGHPIPDRHGRLRRRSLRPLASLGAGESARVREIRDADPQRMARWKEVGLVPGATVRMRAVRMHDDLFEVEVARRRFAMGGQGLDGVMVDRVKGERDA
ncbi:MAG TPA: metal-dependent transcriptional regulator [Candidatus Eisenbacteria bacterium]|nr:metal-dependent transcriptional regulator [Candidatus Eisenbacteria bacterium]